MQVQHGDLPTAFSWHDQHPAAHPFFFPLHGIFFFSKHVVGSSPIVRFCQARLNGPGWGDGETPSWWKGARHQTGALGMDGFGGPTNTKKGDPVRPHTVISPLLPPPPSWERNGASREAGMGRLPTDATGRWATEATGGWIEAIFPGLSVVEMVALVAAGGGGGWAHLLVYKTRDHPLPFGW